MSPTPHLWNDQGDGLSAILSDILDLLNEAANGISNDPVWTVRFSVDPNWNPNTDVTSSGTRKFAGTWELVTPGLVPISATEQEGDYSLTVPQIRQMLSSKRNITGDTLPSTRFPLGGTTGEPSNADGTSRNMNWVVDFAIPIADWAHAFNVILVDGNMGKQISPSPRLLGEAQSGWGSAGDVLVHNGAHRHTLKEGYVQFNSKQNAFDVRQASYPVFQWVRTS